MRMQTVSRRDFLKVSTTSAVSMGSLSLSQKVLPKKPNLLFLWTDEQRPDTLKIYGNQTIHAPNLNKFSEECITFKNAYCTQPVCTSSRCSVMTGLWPHQAGCLYNNIALPENAMTVPEILNDMDYRTGYMGKWHLGDEIFPQHGFHEWVSIEDTYTNYYSPGKDKAERSSYHHFLKNLGYESDLSSNKFSRDFAARLPAEHCKPEFLANEACDFLNRHKKHPFILYVNFLEPHMPFTGPLNDLHDPSSTFLPPSFNEPLNANEPLRNHIFRQWYYENGWEDDPLRTEENWRFLIAKYWGLVTQVDNSIGRILQKLEDLALSDNTIVVFTSDHGDMMGAHRLLGKTFSYEESVQVPLLLRFPQAKRKQYIVNNRVSLIDVVPTLLDLMGNDRHNSCLPGKSLLHRDANQTLEQDFVFIQWNSYYQDLLKRCREDAHNSFKNWLDAKASEEEIMRAISSEYRTVIAPDGWKLSLAKNDRSQLFNLNKDPHELNNLFDVHEYANVVSHLTKKIHSWQEKVNDPLLL